MVSYASLCIYWRWPASCHKMQVFLVFVSCFFMHLSIGSIYTYGNLVPYLVSFARKRSGPPDVRNVDSTYVFASQVCGIGVGMLAGGLLEKRLGPRLVSLSGGLFMSLGVSLSYFSVRFNFWILLATYGAMYGIGVGVAYIGPIACAIKWLPKWKGVASGIVVSGFGISSLIFTALQTAWINPHNLHPDEPLDNDHPDEKYFTDDDLLDRVPYVFLILGGTFSLMQLVSSVFLVNPLPSALRAEESRPIVSGNTTPPIYSPSNSVSESQVIRHRQKHGAGEGVDPLKLLCTSSFYLVWIMFFCVGTGNTMVTSLYKSFGLEDVTKDDHFLSIAGGVSSAFNLLGRLVWGGVADLVSFKFAIVVQGALATGFLYTFYATGAAGEVMYFVWVCGMYFCFGGYYSLYPSLVALLYGTEYVGINYSLMYTSQIVASVLVSFLSKFLVDHIDWFGLFFIVGSLSLVEFVIALCYRNKRYSNKQN